MAKGGRNKLPAELHLVHGTRAEHGAKPLPEKLRERVPKAEWLDNPEAWNRDKFIEETSAFLWDTYGIGSAQDRHVLAACAMQLEIYVLCLVGLKTTGPVVTFNNGSTSGPSPYLTAGDRALNRALVLMGELGLTPKTRLASNKKEAGKYSKLLAGPSV